MKMRQVIGVSLILVGIMLCVMLLGYQYFHCCEMWEMEKKFMAYDTFRNYFLDVSDGVFALSILLDGIPFCAGIWFCANK